MSPKSASSVNGNVSTLGMCLGILAPIGKELFVVTGDFVSSFSLGFTITTLSAGFHFEF